MLLKTYAGALLKKTQLIVNYTGMIATVGLKAHKIKKLTVKLVEEVGDLDMGNKPSWTPGPWWRSHNIQEIFADFDGEQPCVVARAYSWVGDGAERVTTTVANANLIAAAPDLYRELYHLNKLLNIMLQHGVNVPGLGTMNGAMDALAKARGEAPDDL